uniref:Uncharacterized protein n=1 Tax=Cryptomonas curvata TaxID=233186 RepID=A0A7S0LVC6_9CRYP|mmetsp:Transcript_12096/g.25985  ORF Transcript_12096/g.25985 Transcript_12096/m.25985 type:complete len:168 (+) Transcript_12096:1-504(+)
MSVTMCRRVSVTEQCESSRERLDPVVIQAKNVKKEGMLAFNSMPNLGASISAVKSTFQMPARPWEASSMLTPDDHIIWAIRSEKHTEMILKRSKNQQKDPLKKAKSPPSASYDLESLESLWTQISLEPDIVYPTICEYPDVSNKTETVRSKILLGARTIDRIPSIGQ